MIDGKVNFLIYKEDDLKIGFGLLDNENYLVMLGSRYIEVEKKDSLYMSLLPLLQLDILLFKSAIERKGYNFFQIVPVEKILLTAFSDGGSFFWKEKGLFWIEKLKYASPTIISMLIEKSSTESKLSKDFKFKIKKVLKNLTSK